MSTNIYLVLLAVYLLCGVACYIGGARLLSRVIKKRAAKQIGGVFSSVLTLVGLFLMTWAYLHM